MEKKHEEMLVKGLMKEILCEVGDYIPSQNINGLSEDIMGLYFICQKCQQSS